MKLKRVIRLDSTPLTKASYTPEGYLLDKPILTSTGIFEYGNPDGSVRRELRLPEEVFDPESLKSYKGRPVIITHDAGLIDKSNVGEESIGTILSEGFRDGDDVRAEIIIHDTDEMKKSHLKELSLGYNLDLDETPGEWHGEHYDAIQRNIRINHLALVREARAGEQARLNIDSRDDLKGAKKGMRKTIKKTTRRADGVLSPEELKKAIEEYKARRKDECEEEETDPAEMMPVPKKAQGDADPASEENPEEALATVKENKDRRDAEGEPTDMEEANGVIARQDEDIQTLIDIIDTLLAEKEFDEAEDPKAKEKLPFENVDEDEELPPEEETDGDDLAEEDLENEDEDDDVIPNTENEDDDDDVIPNADPTNLKPGEVMNADSIDAIVRARVKLGMAAEKLHLDGIENMSLTRAKKLIIKTVRPGIRLDGKSATYINAMFDCACDELNKRSRKDTNYQRRQMFNKDSRTVYGKSESSDAARNRMIQKREKMNKEGK